MREFTHPVTNQRKLRQLFFETQGADKSAVVYTLKDKDHEGYPSLYRLYMEADDPTEYSFAVENLDSWDHWETLCQCTWFKPYISKWRHELEIRYKSRSLKQLNSIAADPSHKDHTQTNKFLVTQGWKTDERRKGAGRPSKDEISKAAKEIASDAQSISDDLARVIGTVQ